MKLYDDDLTLLQDISISAVLEAGAIITRYKKEGFKSIGKDVGSSAASKALTEVDLLCQSVILCKLNPAIEKFGLGLLTEECIDDSSRLSKEYFFCIDPMDGTYSFIHSDCGFSVSISLVTVEGEPILGVVYDPVSENLYTSIKGRGLYKNEVKWNPRFGNTQILTVLKDPSFTIEKGMNGVFIEHGGAVLNAIEVLEGRADCYMKLPKISDGGGSIWDFAATALFFYECGASATDIWGNSLNFNNPVTTFMNRTGVLYCNMQKIAQRVQEELLNQSRILEQFPLV